MTELQKHTDPPTQKRGSRTVIAKAIINRSISNYFNPLTALPNTPGKTEMFKYEKLGLCIALLYIALYK
jgi:hypothetical protein